MAVSFAPTTYELQPGANATQLVVGSGDKPENSQGGLIVNLDLVNSAMVGGYGVNQNDPTNFATIPPLGSIQYDGTEDIYGNAFAGQNVEVQILPGIKNWTPSPAEVAAQIAALGLATEATQQIVKTNTGDTVSTLGTPAQDPTVTGLNTGIPTQMLQAGVGVTNELAALIATGSAAGNPGGVPLLAKSTVFSNPGNQTFTSGLLRQYGAPSPFPQISYEIFLSLTSNASETNPQFVVELDWFNSTSGQTVSVERWLLCGGAGVANVYVGTGRAKGDQLQINITNNGTLSSGTCRVVILQSSRVYIKDDFRSTVFNGIPGVPNAGWDASANVIMETAPTVAASAQVQRSLSMYAGTVRLAAFTQTGTASIFIGTQDLTFTNNTVFQGSVPANGFSNQQFDLPRKQCILIITNTGSSSQQIGVAIYTSEQNV
jgi:hypothetical protein